LAADLPLLARDGGFIAAGYRADMDELRGLRDESRRHIAALQARYASTTGVPSLKIRHNNVIGYFVEINPRFAGQLGPEFRHRQSLANAARYGSDELAALESSIGQAAARVLAIESEIFDALVAQATARADAIRAAAAAAAALDVAAAAAEIAAEPGWCRPLVDDSLSFEVRGGRHPVVAAALKAAGGAPFVANGCDLAPEHRLWLLTGPNMAGKSTYLRQNALIAVLAQAGCYVPAEFAHMGVVDRLFSRVGAGDDLARGRSTFMVEMLETAAILNQAGPRALVILDEIGRGTATFDGLSIAWATVEHLHDANRCRAIFATHFHELTALAAKLDALSNHTMRVKEWRGDVVFLHEVAPGAVDRAYGLHVAKLAGVPRAVLKRAGQVMQALEKSGQSGAVGKLVDDLPLFSAVPEAAEAPDPSAVEMALAGVDLDGLTPREALDVLYRLKSLLAGGGAGSSR
jgi:DNA mismatch repair protein MutS